MLDEPTARLIQGPPSPGPAAAPLRPSIGPFKGHQALGGGAGGSQMMFSLGSQEPASPLRNATSPKPAMLLIPLLLGADHGPR
jgi:hypothetical protein